MEKQICPACKTEYVNILPDKCEKCRYPFSGTKQEQGRYIGRQIVMKGVSKTTLSIVQGLQALFAVSAAISLGRLFFSAADPVNIITNITIGIACVVEVLIIRKKPFIGVMAALITFVLYLALIGLNDPSALFRSFVVKLVVIGALGYCLFNLKRMKDFYGTYRPDRSGLI